jgi:hypothetical protein
VFICGLTCIHTQEHYEQKLADAKIALETQLRREHADITRDLERQQRALEEGHAMVRFQQTAHQQLVDNLAQVAAVARLLLQARG